MSHEPPRPADAPDPARSFGSVADSYDRGRPTYPIDAARWLTADQTTGAPLQVLELGAGTGKLTAQLVALGHEVHATDPDPAMLAILNERLPDVRTSQASAEEIPAGDRTYDVVVSAQAFHWFDHDRALPEIARVLRTSGRLSLVWNERDERVPWVRRLGAIIGTQEQLSDPRDIVEASAYFAETETAEFKHRQQIDKRSIHDLVLSRSNVATLPTPQREAKLAEVAAFYEEYGRGMDGMLLPYLTRCFRFRAGHAPVSGVGVQADVVTEGSDDDLLLIDFR